MQVWVARLPRGAARPAKDSWLCSWDSKQLRDDARAGTWSWGLPAVCARQRAGASAGARGGGASSSNEKGRPKWAPSYRRQPASGVCADGSGPSNDGAAIALAQHAQLVQLGLGQVGEAVRKVEQRIVEPFLLMFQARLQHSAAEDVGEQLVARLFETGGNRVLPGLTTLFGHAGGFPFGRGAREKRRRKIIGCMV